MAKLSAVRRSAEEREEVGNVCVQIHGSTPAIRAVQEGGEDGHRDTPATYGAVGVSVTACMNNFPIYSSSTAVCPPFLLSTFS